MEFKEKSNLLNLKKLTSPNNHIKSKVMNPKVLFLILFPLFVFSQSPQKINFQSILRNTNGEIVANKSVSLKISILSGSINGSSVYAETHTKTTDASGLISLQIGNGTVLSGVFANIGWGNASHFIKLEVDFNGGSNYVVLGTQELMSVPYALYASKTDTSSLNLTNRLGEKVNVSDTSTMLNPYLRKASIQNSTLELFGIHSWEYPEGFSKEFVTISDDNLPYTVPNGKNLYTFQQGVNLIINGINYINGFSNYSFVVKEGITISGLEGINGLSNNICIGFLVRKSDKIIPVNLALNTTNLSYTVPSGKILFLKSGGYLNIGNKGITFPNGFGIPIMEGTVINLRDSFNATYGFTGYLIDK